MSLNAYGSYIFGKPNKTFSLFFRKSNSRIQLNTTKVNLYPYTSSIKVGNQRIPRILFILAVWVKVD
jgi:hypothetical protein